MVDDGVAILPGRHSAPDWRADGWFLERRHPADWSRRTELVLPDHDQAAKVDRWWGSMTSCGWHGWHARSSRANLSRPARLRLVADQVCPAVTPAAMARQVFSLLPAYHPSVGAHRRPQRVSSAFSHHLVQSPNGHPRLLRSVAGPPGPRTDFASPSTDGLPGPARCLHNSR